MKHHFGDMLDRSGGHWAMTPNRERWQHHFNDVSETPNDLHALTLTKSDTNWELADGLGQLEELTLHEPSREQLFFAMNLCDLKRLRITHARPKSLDFLRGLSQLEELILEYVSGCDDLRPIADLPKLRSLHLENLRRVRDFSGLAGVKALKYLSIDGTFDWAQPVSDLVFVSRLEQLEYLRLWNVRVLTDPPAFRPLTKLLKLKKLSILDYAFPLEDFAYLEAALPNVEGAAKAPYKVSPPERQVLHHTDLRARMPEAELREVYPDIEVTVEGERYQNFPEYTYFLGKGQRTAAGFSHAVAKRRDKHAARYQELVDLYRAQIS